MYKKKNIIVEVPEYNNKFFFNRENGFSIKFEIDHKNNQILLQANKAGLLSIANHLMNIAQDNVPDGYHIHLDEFNSLENGSNEIIIKKNNNLLNE